MADEIPGGYYLAGNGKAAHNAKGEAVELLSDAEIAQHIEDQEPAPPLSAESRATVEAADARDEQHAAAGGKKKKK